jgi:hypothetical protein
MQVVLELVNVVPFVLPPLETTWSRSPQGVADGKHAGGVGQTWHGVVSGSQNEGTASTKPAWSVSTRPAPRPRIAQRSGACKLQPRRELSRFEILLLRGRSATRLR